MDNAEPREPSKVPHIDCQQLPDAVNVHAGGQAGVVDLHAFDLMCDDKLPPAVMDIAAVRQKFEVPFDYPGDTIRLGDGQSEPVSIKRPGRSVPELGQVLRGKTEPRLLRNEHTKRPAD